MSAAARRRSITYRIPQSAARQGMSLSGIGPGMMGAGRLGWFDDELVPITDDSSWSWDLFGEASGGLPPVASGLPATQPAGNWWDTLAQSAQKLLPSILTYQQAKDLNDINLERARKGQPPLSPAQYAPQVNVGVAPQTQQMITYALLGLGALGIWFMMSGTRR